MSRIVWLAPFHVSFVPSLRATARGRLISGGSVGQEVHAASALRERRMTLDDALLAKPSELRRIVVHELFHFAWVRLGNTIRRDWERLLEGELRSGTRGELGWSAEWRKRELTAGARRRRNRRWRDYACESFCDTAAWLLTGARTHEEATLGQRAAAGRAQWFLALFRSRGVTL